MVEGPQNKLNTYLLVAATIPSKNTMSTRSLKKFIGDFTSGKGVKNPSSLLNGIDFIPIRLWAPLY